LRGVEKTSDRKKKEVPQEKSREGGASWGERKTKTIERPGEM
jgi:hypothetical protein